MCQCRKLTPEDPFYIDMSPSKRETKANLKRKIEQDRIKASVDWSDTWGDDVSIVEKAK
jgi:hypothetical protein